VTSSKSYFRQRRTKEPKSARTTSTDHSSKTRYNLDGFCACSSDIATFVHRHSTPRNTATEGSSDFSHRGCSC